MSISAENGQVVWRMTTCSVSECNRAPHARGWCDMHYKRWRKNGDPLLGGLRPFPENLLGQLRWDSDGCVRFTGGLSKGYGKVWNGKRTVAAHVAMWELMVGAVPDGMELDHLCHTTTCTARPTECPHRACVNPAHLDPKTPRENVLRSRNPPAINAAKTHCIHGHEFTPENTHMRPRGNRECRECVRNRARRYRAQKGRP